MAADLPHVVIVGGGFAGLAAARGLRREPVRVTLIDRRNYHLFLPLLYQVATSGLNPGDIAAPIRRILRSQRNTTVVMREVVSVDLDARRVLFEDGHLQYDYLILAAGSKHAYFEEGWARHAPGLTTIEDALEIRRRLLLASEAAEREPDPVRRRALLTSVVIGGGPTGVELAGAIAEMGMHVGRGEYRNFDPRTARVLLIEGMERVLPGYPADLSRKAAASLSRLGVEVRVSTRVTGLDGNGVDLGEERVEASNVFWAAGVRASGLAESLRAPLDRRGRVLVASGLRLAGRGEVLVIGDLAAVPAGESFVPALAPAAVQQGRHAARSIGRLLRGKEPRPFRYRNRGQLATIGRAAAVADLGWLRFSGFVAWMAWLTVHIFFLIGFRNRLLVLTQWAWAYFTYERGVKLLGPETEANRRS